MKHFQHRLLYFLLGLALGILLGGVLGGVTALWLAPQTGKQTQTLVRRQGKALKRQAGKTVSLVNQNF